MEYIINQSSINQYPVISRQEEVKPCGILNSEYQKVVQQNLDKPDLNTIYGKRRMVKSRTFYHATSAETILKVVVFLTILGFII